MRKELEDLKQRIPLLDYLQQHHWTLSRRLAGQEFVGLCPFHRDHHPSFYVNARKNLFYCHGCGFGGDLIRFVELSEHLTFRHAVAYLQQELDPLASARLLTHTAAFYQLQLHRHAQAVEYLDRRGIRDPHVIERLGIGYAAGGGLHRHLAALGYSFHHLLQIGLINPQGRDTFCHRIVFPCVDDGQVLNLYGRSTGTAGPHRLLPRSKGGLFAWESVNRFATLILVEGLFDLAVLWQAGFPNTTCAIGLHLTQLQWQQLSSRPQRSIYIAFDQDENQAGQQASLQLARRLQIAGIRASIVQLPPGHDPNSYFAAGATAADFHSYLQKAHSL
jgi:DNA primase